MKKFTLIIALVIGFVINAQETLEKTIGEFSTVKVYDLINLKMIKSNENKVVITGKKTENDIELLNNNGKLKIRMNIEESYDGNETDVVLYYTSV